ncbi:ribonuclease H-like [Tamandua tetradactyla]|uniref:ribonuclease H-like n=1 Tax=Tamandua tetradactyla TaxID=48850 RepID=UPI00405467B6
MEELTYPRQGLSDTPLSQADLTLFVDGSSVIDQQGKCWASYVTVLSTEILEAIQLPEGNTSQKAELIALTRALYLAENKSVNIYTDSKYAFLVAHCHSAIWKERGFLTTKGSPVINAKLIQHLLQELLFPSQVAIIHCKGHQTDNSDITCGNNWTNAVA